MGASATKKPIKPELSQAQMENLKTRTRMTEEEIAKWYSKLSIPFEIKKNFFFSKMDFIKIVQMVF